MCSSFTLQHTHTQSTIYSTFHFGGCPINFLLTLRICHIFYESFSVHLLRSCCYFGNGSVLFMWACQNEKFALQRSIWNRLLLFATTLSLSFLSYSIELPSLARFIHTVQLSHNVHTRTHIHRITQSNTIRNANFIYQSGIHLFLLDTSVCVCLSILWLFAISLSLYSISESLCAFVLWTKWNSHKAKEEQERERRGKKQNAQQINWKWEKCTRGTKMIYSWPLTLKNCADRC